MGNVRLRQVALAALDGAKVIHRLGATFGLSRGYEDPAVAGFGLENRVFALGNQFLEIVSPVTDTAPVSRFLEKTGRRSAGYMVILEVDSVVPYWERAEALGCRVVLESDSETWGTLHLHPRDMGSLLSVDQDKGGDWIPAGPDWREWSKANVITGIAGVRIAAADPVAMANRWAALLGIPSSSGGTLHLSQGTIKFVPVTSGIDGLVALDLTSSEEGRLGECHTIAGTQFQIVKVAV